MAVEVYYMWRYGGLFDKQAENAGQPWPRFFMIKRNYLQQ